MVGAVIGIKHGTRTKGITHDLLLGSLNAGLDEGIVDLLVHIQT